MVAVFLGNTRQSLDALQFRKVAAYYSLNSSAQARPAKHAVANVHGQWAGWKRIAGLASGQPGDDHTGGDNPPTGGEVPAGMARLSMNEMTTYRWSFEEDVHNYAAAGYDAVAVWRQKLSDFGEVKGAELLAENRLAVSSLLWAGGFTGSDGRSYRDSIDDAVEAIHQAADLQADSLVLYSGSRAGHTHNHAKRLFKSAIEELAPVADQRDVTLAIEPMHAGCAGAWTFLTDLDETLEVLSWIGCPRLKLVFDAYHLGQEPTVVARLPELAPMIALVQLGDARVPPNGEQNRCQLGQGNLPLKEIVNSVLQGGYDGYFDVELMGEDLECPDYIELIQQSKRVFSELQG
jgi:sugar phosphate isomerase/epimerase